MVPVVEMYCSVALKVVVPERFSVFASASMVAAIPESSPFPSSLRPISNILEGNATTSVAHMARAAMQSEYFMHRFLGAILENCSCEASYLNKQAWRA
jgi:hypothetical protein